MRADKSFEDSQIEMLAESIISNFVALMESGDGMTVAQIGILGRTADALARKIVTHAAADDASGSALSRGINAGDETLAELRHLAGPHVAEAFLKAAQSAIEEARAEVIVPAVLNPP
jgi:hypothetical protein